MYMWLHTYLNALHTHTTQYHHVCGRRGDLKVCALNSGLKGLGLSPGLGHCIVFLGKTLDSHSTSLHPGAYK